VMFGSTSVIDRLADFRRAAPRTRLILLSGYLDAATISAGRAAGFAGFAEKTQSVAEIVTTFLKVAAGQMVVPASVRGVPGPRRAGAQPDPTARRLASLLTPRERQVLSALVGGVDTSTLADRLGVTTGTARCHIQSILIKMRVHSRLEAATTAVRIGLLDPESGDWYV
jgi:two-component system, NarL family, nitrate/nitrite response regulator NarL